MNGDATTSEKRELLVEDDDGTQKTFETQGRVYLIIRKRWGILAIVSVVLFLDIFSSIFFSFVNDATSKYFRILPSLTDVLSTVTMISRGLFAFVIAIFGSRLSFRVITLGASGAVLIGGLMIAVGVSSRTNYFIVIIGQVISGFGTTTALTLSQMASTNWFPKPERGRAVAFPWLTRRLSMVASSLVATHAIEGNGSSKMLSTIVKTFQTSYVATFLGLSGVSFIIFCMAEIFVSDHPPESSVNSNAPKPEEKSVLEHLKGILNVFQNKAFLLSLVLYSLLLAQRPLYDVLLSSIVLAGFPNLDDKFVSTMYSIGLTIGAFGGPICGLILDLFKKPRITLIAGLLGMILSCAIYSIALHLQNIYVLYVANISMAVTRDFSLVGIQHALVVAMDHETKSIRVKAFSLSVSIPWMLVPVYTIIIRKTLVRFGPSIAVLVPTPFLLLLGVIWVFTWKVFHQIPSSSSES